MAEKVEAFLEKYWGSFLRAPLKNSRALYLR
jgi:hypothetical protein